MVVYGKIKRKKGEHSIEDIVTIETINIKNYVTGDIEPFNLVVYAGENDYPHFHILDKYENIYCSIKINTSEYYFHNNTKEYRLSNDDINKLINALNKCDEYFECSNYNLICMMWNHCHKHRHRVKKPYKMPDYTKLND